MAPRSAARSDVGLKREANEDFHASEPDRGLYVVADGLGGHAAGRRAAETGVTTLLARARPSDGVPASEVLREATRGAGWAIHDLAASDPSLKGMGTTIVALWMQGRWASWAHVGDSRLYLYRSGRLRRLTLDHSLVGEWMARRRLSEREARSHPQRHVITRALGVQPRVEPDTARMRVREGDLFVLCTDGVCGPLVDAQIEALLSDAGADLGCAAEALIAAANRVGGDDNSTVVLVGV